MVKLPTVQDFMDTIVHTLSPDTDIIDAVDFLLQKRVTGAPVVLEDQTLVGILSEKDCLKLLATGSDNQRPTGKVRDFMTEEVTTIPPTMNVYFVAGMFLTAAFRRLPVVQGDKLVGAITRFDILRAIQGNLK
ncbi:MAG: CBS domain-containing protein [Myxococcota bacterium]|nr:CBS domain-containing protein [Myxococcota bacterium]